MPVLLERLKEYESQRDRYPTFDAFLPRFFDAFPKKKAAP
jgi:hypothetical protein